MSIFPKVHEIVPEGAKGLAKIEHFEVDRIHFRFSDVLPGKYTRLFVQGSGLMMSDTGMEHRTNFHVIKKAHGDVLIAGLGIGMLLKPLLEKEEVKTITVIEKHQDVIDLVASYYSHEKLNIICSDIFQWKPEKNQKFDVIYFDIWANICEDNLDEITKLHRRGKFWLNRSNDNCWMGSWVHDELKSLRCRSKREERQWGR